LSFINVTLKRLMLLRIVLFGSSLAIALTQPVGAQDGAAIYKSKCATCHGPNGEGDTPTGRSMKVTSLKAAVVQKKSDTKLIQIISAGSRKMPAYGRQLSSADIKAVVTFIRTMK
jgi:cytochrome c6